MPILAPAYEISQKPDFTALYTALEALPVNRESLTIEYGSEGQMCWRQAAYRWAARHNKIVTTSTSERIVDGEIKTFVHITRKK